MIKSGVAHLEMKDNNADLVILMIYVNKKYICVASVNLQIYSTLRICLTYITFKCYRVVSEAVIEMKDSYKQCLVL